MYKFIIIDRQKGNFNERIKILKKKFSPDEIPVLSEDGGGIWETPNETIAKSFIKMGICETLKQKEDRLKNEKLANSILSNQEDEPITLEAATEDLSDFAEYFHDLATEQKYFQRKDNHKIMSFRDIDILITSYFESINKNSSGLIRELARRMESRAHENGVEMFTRFGIKDDNIYYQLNNEKCVEIKLDGWNIIDIQSRDIKFRPIIAKSNQVEPIHTDKNISEFINLFRCGSHKEEILVSGALISGVVPKIPSPLINIVAPHSSGKSKIANRIKLTIDPIEKSEQGFLLPNTKRDLILTLSQHPCFILDNISNIRDSLSDIISAAITGASVPDRKLYTDDDLLIKSLYTFVVFTGITDNVKLADLRARTIDLNVTYSEDQTMSERELTNEFNSQLPELLGCIFNHVVEYLNYDTDVIPPNKYRMIDYYKILKIIEPHFSLNINEILFDDMCEKSLENIYNESIGRYLINKLVHDGTGDIGCILMGENENEYMNMTQLFNMMKGDQHSDALYANSATMGKGFIRIESDLKKYGITRIQKSLKSNLFKFEYIPQEGKYQLYSIDEVDEVNELGEIDEFDDVENFNGFKI